jgi:hypothetical protein
MVLEFCFRVISHFLHYVTVNRGQEKIWVFEKRLFGFHLNQALVSGPMVKGHNGDFLMRFQGAYQLDKTV